MPTKILLLSPQARTLRAWSQALDLESELEIEAVAGEADAVTPLLDVEPPDLALVELSAGTSLAQVEHWAATHPRTDFLAVSAETGPETLLRAMRAGVREVLPAPAAPDAVLAALRRQLRKRFPAAADPRGATGEVLGVVSCKGGAGTTLVAVNLAHLLARQGRRRVLLIDLNLQFGDAALCLTTRPAPRHIADLARDIGRLDAELLRSSLVEAGPGLWVLAAPEDPTLSAEVTPAHVRRIVQVARGLHDHVVLDVGRLLNPVTLQALDLADRVYPVLQLTLPFLRDAQRLKRVFEGLGYPTDKIRWVVNRHQPGTTLTLRDLQRALGTERIATLPNQYEVATAAIDQGRPVAEVAPRSALQRGLQALTEAAPQAPQADRTPSWWGRWLQAAPVAR